MSSVHLQLLLSTGLGLAAAPALAQNTAGPDTDLTCAEEVEAFLDNVRGDDAYPRIAATFERYEARLRDAAIGDEAGCFVVLGEAQRYLVGEDVEVLGASDQASLERIERVSVALGNSQQDVVRSLDGAVADGATVTRRTIEIAPVDQDTIVPGSEMIDVAPANPDSGADDVVATAPDVATIPDAADRPDAVVLDTPSDIPTASSEATASSTAATDVTAGVEVLAVREVEFGFDSADVTAAARTDVLEEVAALATENTDATVLLTGYASPMGDADYNRRLSERRVQAVAEALGELGVAPDAIRTRARGEQDLEVPASEDELSEENRRVEIRIETSSAPERG